MLVVGIDPSLSNFGLAKGYYYRDENVFELDELKLVETSPDNKNKKVVRKNSDDLTRAGKLFKATKAFIEDVDVVIAEVPVGSQSARSMASYGICVGILASLNIPIIQVTPQEVKVIATGSKTASKQDMIDWAYATYPKSNFIFHTRNGQQILSNKNEHLADAIATIHAGIASDTFQQLLKFQRSVL